MDPLKKLVRDPQAFVESQREVARWTVPDWTLDYYIARGAYGHTFLARGIGGIVKVVKIFDLLPDAVDDLRRMYGLESEPGSEEYLTKLKEVLGHEAIYPFWNSLSSDERRRILLPQTFISNVRSNDGVVTYASINEVLESTLDDEIREGKYNSPDKFLPLIRQILEVLAIVHKKRTITEPIGPLDFSAEEIVKFYEQSGAIPPGPLPPNVADATMTHNDIKPSNVGFDHQHDAVAFDFGVATTFSQRDNYPNIGTLTRRAPELHRIGAKPSPRSDVWQAGILIHEIISGSNPAEYKDEKPPKTSPVERAEFEERLPELLEKDIPIALEKLHSAGVPINLVEVIEACLQTDPEKRPKDCGEVLEAFDKSNEGTRVDYVRGHPILLADSKEKLVEWYDCAEISHEDTPYVAFQLGLKEFSELLEIGKSYEKRDLGGLLIAKGAIDYKAGSSTGTFEGILSKDLGYRSFTIEFGGGSFEMDEIDFDDDGVVHSKHDVVLAARQDDRKGMANLLNLARQYKAQKDFKLAARLVDEDNAHFAYSTSDPEAPIDPVIPAAAEDGVVILRGKSGRNFIPSFTPEFRKNIIGILELAKADVHVFLGKSTFYGEARPTLTDLTRENVVKVDPSEDFYIVAEGEPKTAADVAKSVFGLFDSFSPYDVIIPGE